MSTYETYVEYFPGGGGTWAPVIKTREIEMNDINLDTVELKKAEFTANVGDKQITAKVTDKDQADKAAEVLPA